MNEEVESRKFWKGSFVFFFNSERVGLGGFG